MLLTLSLKAKERAQNSPKMNLKRFKDNIYLNIIKPFLTDHT